MAINLKLAMAMEAESPIFESKSNDLENYIQTLQKSNHYVRVSGDKHLIVCPWDENHTTGQPGDGSTVMSVTDGKVWIKCQHAHCSERRTKDFVSFFGLKQEVTLLKKSSQKLQLTSIKELIEKPQIENDFLVKGLLDLSNTSVLGGKPKSGKTTYAKALAFCVASGKPFMGRETKMGAVCYLALEDKESELKKTFINHGCTGEERLYFHIGQAPALIIEELEAAIAKYHPILIVIDTLFKAVKVKDNNAYNEVIEALAGIEQLARKNKVHIMSLHHLNKHGNGGTDSMLGSTGISASADTLIFINRDTNNQRTIAVIQRYGEDIASTSLNLDLDSGLPVLGEQTAISYQNRIKSDILSLLKDEKHEFLFEELASKVQGKEANVRQALNALVKEGLVYRAGKGTKGAAFIYSNMDISTF